MVRKPSSLSDSITTREEASAKAPSKGSKKNNDRMADDLSEEDLALKQKLELYIERLQDSDLGLVKVALESMRQEIRTSIDSMTVVPKPLRFLRPHYETLKAYYKMMDPPDLKKSLADILSVLAVTMSAEGDQESLKYRLSGSEGDIGSWGHEYVRNLAGEIAQEYNKRMMEDAPIPICDLMELVDQIVVFYMKHNAGPEAIDLLMEVDDTEGIEQLEEYLDTTNYKRTCLYLKCSARYFPDDVDRIYGLDITCSMYMKFEDFSSAFVIALFCENIEIVHKVFDYAKDLLQKKQLCFILARNWFISELYEEMCPDDDDRETLQDIVNNTKLSEGYLTLARDIEVMEPKTPDDVYKDHMVNRPVTAVAHANLATLSKQNLASTYVNAFVNAGFGQDKLMTVPLEDLSDGSSGHWLFQNPLNGKISAVASLGMILLWDIDTGLAHIDKYLHSNDNHIISGALLGIGIVNCGVKHHYDPALKILADYIANEDDSIRISAIMGLGLAYAGSQNEEIRDILTPILRDQKLPVDMIAFAAISLGLVYVGSCNKEGNANTLINALLTHTQYMGQPIALLLPLGLGLLYLGKKDLVEDQGIIEAISKIPNEIIRKYCNMTLLSCAYAGTGNVLKVQHFLEQCTQPLGIFGYYKGPAVLGIAMVAMADEVGLEMAIRLFEHLLQFGDYNIRRVVPLALGLLCISNPKDNITDILKRLSHSRADIHLSMRAIISLGLIGAGTNNARVADALLSLSRLYYSHPDCLFCVRIAQGLLHMGKGLLTLDPYHSEHFLLSRRALGGIIILLHACLNVEYTLLGRYDYVLYYLVSAMQPRMLLTVDENLKPLSVPVRVGRAVDVTGQAGQPRTITDFKTFSTPVLLAVGDRAELATEKYIPLSPILEGCVILKENPDYMEES